jgi:spore germination protein KA
MAQAREGIPFPAFVETVLMLMLFEILRESGLRLPRAIGQTVSIAGTLIIGQAAVEAGIISTPMVIIGSLTGITAFIVPPLMDASVFFRFMLVILSSIFGFYGIIVGLINMLAYICSIRSFGVSYFAPLAPRFLGGMKDTLIRVPLWIMQSRPKALKSPNITRQAKDLKPKPDENKKGEEES